MQRILLPLTLSASRKSKYNLDEKHLTGRGEVVKFNQTRSGEKCGLNERLMICTNESTHPCLFGISRKIYGREQTFFFCLERHE